MTPAWARIVLVYGELVVGSSLAAIQAILVFGFKAFKGVAILGAPQASSSP